MSSLSVVITTYNNAATLARCLASVVSLADELLVLDSFSTDNTEQIASQYKARFIQEAFRGYGPQKQFAVDLAKHDWILLLDADEALSHQLQTEIQLIKPQLQPQLRLPGFRLRRREWLAWREPIERYGRWQHCQVKRTDHLRLFDRRVVKLSDHPVHAAPVSHSPTPLLKHDLLHWGDAPFHHRQEKARRYAELGAHIGSRWFAMPKLILAPAWAFVQDYFLRRGFLNPLLGLVAASHSAYASFLKYWWRIKR